MEKQGRLSGKTLGGKYRFDDLLGNGGVGTVYRGHHLSLNRTQAIKVLLEHISHEEKFRTRFLREAQIVAALDHPHIIHIDDFGVDEQEAYLVMPFIGGGTFSDILNGQREPLPVEQVVLYLEQICSALDYAHQQNVVHLDLKPQNLLIRKDGGLLLSDFGLAHSLNQEIVEGGTSLTFGTPHYMAPEHSNGQPNKSSDVYALGVLLFQMLVGQLPFKGTAEAVTFQHRTKSHPLLRSLRPELPIELEEVLGRALAKEPEQRFRSAGAILHAFKGALAHVQEQKLNAETEERQKAEEEQARKVEEVQLQRAKEVQTLRDEIEQLRNNKEEQAHQTMEELQWRTEPDQALKAKQPARLKISRRLGLQLLALVALVIISGISGAGIYQNYLNQVSANATAQVIANNPYPSYLSGNSNSRLAFVDPLNQEDWNKWTLQTSDGEKCQFAEGVYHAIEYQTDPSSFTWCFANGTFSNFAFEVQLTITQGDCGGMVFRTSDNQHYYYFDICQDGTYKVRKYANNDDSTAQLLSNHSNSSVIHTGLGRQNTIAIVADGSTMTFYVNEKQIDRVQDSSYTSGAIGLIARPQHGNATDIAYTNARLWIL